MKILIIGSGAREHAIAYKLHQSPKVEKIYAAPGNAGIANLAEIVDLHVTEVEVLADFAQQEKIDLTIVGPEDPLCMGIVDVFEQRGLKAFGPKKNPAQLEGSKSFAKEFMLRNEIPTAAYFRTEDPNHAKVLYKELWEKSPYKKAVIKADGLCAGKGVLVGESLEEGYAFIDRIEHNEFSSGDFCVVIEEYLEGIEASLLCFVDHNTIVPMPTAKDHKRIFEAERGPNTGGMGTYSPNPMAQAYLEEMMEQAAWPFHRGLAKEGLSYRGIIFFGFMITEQGVKVLEFNVRFGDPETQSILMRLESDLAEIFSCAMEDRLSDLGEIRWSQEQSVTLVMASEGYPMSYVKGKEILGLLDVEMMPQTAVFHAGTKNMNGMTCTNGGRVLSLTALRKTTDEAMKAVYEMARRVGFEGKTYRKDIGPMVKRVYVCKRAAYDLEAMALRKDLKDSLDIDTKAIRLYQRYDIQGLSIDELKAISDTILREPPVDEIFIQEEAFFKEKEFERPLIVQLHKGQYDQREDGLLQSICLALGKEDVRIRVSKVYDLQGAISEEDLQKIKSYVINPVDQQEGSMKLPNLLEEEKDVQHKALIIENFIMMDESKLREFFEKTQPAMNFEDMKYLQRYFVEERRNPTDVELAMIDTYWSDHCRHTTFNTVLHDVHFVPSGHAEMDELLKKTYEEYQAMRKQVGREEKPVTLMDMATVMTRWMRQKGELEDLEVSDEINACSVNIKVKIEKDGVLSDEDYLLMFKNETHNHPTEIEPFGGASTCLGGAIRDPLSGRSYVYQAMRLTGAADPREAVSDTLPGKLPQKKITIEAAAGYSSYGNQIGLCTGYVDEVYHPGFKAKRMEVGAVIGAAPAENVVRKQPQAGDRIILIGGRTGRDGVGGATGSSKEHTEKSIERSSAEVQKGNAPSERKLLRLFRKKEAANLIKKCNDFGAGGVSVAIGELSDGLYIDLDKVPLKYAGLTPREIAISESQERMACVVDANDVEQFMAYCKEENIEATEVAKVTAEKRLVMTYRGDVVVDLDRAFLDSAGVTATQEVQLSASPKPDLLHCWKEMPWQEQLKERLGELNICSKKGLIERFDNTIGASSVLLPLGGKSQLTPAQGMASYIPVAEGISHTASLMTCGYEPYLSEKSPYHGAYYAVFESVSKIVAMGGAIEKTRLSFQEYFEKLGKDPEKWGKPTAALLGALKAQRELKIPAIGGKDSMSGTFKEIHVPPTLISFAVTATDADRVLSPELKTSGSILGLLYTPYTQEYTLCLESYRRNVSILQELAESGKIRAAYALTHEGVLPALTKMALGNQIGVQLDALPKEHYFAPAYGSFLLELTESDDRVYKIGQTVSEKIFSIDQEEIMLDSLQEAYERPLEEIFPTRNRAYDVDWKQNVPKSSKALITQKAKIRIAKPNVVIGVFPGSNCEYDTAMAFERAGARTQTKVFRNLSMTDIEESVKELEEAIRQSQILMLPGGFSLGDEPDGSGKFIAAVLRNPRIADAIDELIHQRDGLILGICNGFQALIKTGLLPYGRLRILDEKAPTLTHNQIGRHVAQFVKTKVMTDRSPWTQEMNIGEIHDIAVSHGEGRIIAQEETIQALYEAGQVAFQYVTPQGEAAVERPYNPNGSMGSIEGLISPCGRILGKMGHSERMRKGLYKNYPISERQLLFEGGVNYYK